MLFLSFISTQVEAKSKDGAKKAKKSSDTKKKKNKAGAAEDHDDDGWGPSAGKPRALKDWQKLGSKDWEKLEDKWLEDEAADPADEDFKWSRGPDGSRRPPDRKGPKTEMGFVTVNTDIKSETEAIAKRWQQLLKTGGVEGKAYAVEDNKIIFVVEGGFVEMMKIRDFALNQDEAVNFEWNQKTFNKPTKTSTGGKKPKKPEL